MVTDPESPVDRGVLVAGRLVDQLPAHVRRGGQPVDLDHVVFPLDTTRRGVVVTFMRMVAMLVGTVLMLEDRELAPLLSQEIPDRKTRLATTDDHHFAVLAAVVHPFDRIRLMSVVHSHLLLKLEVVAPWRAIPIGGNRHALPMHAANDDRVPRLGGVAGAVYRVPVPPTKRLSLRAESAKTIELIASVTGTTRNRVGRRTRLPITSKPPPAVERLNVPSTPRTRQGLRTSRVRRLARTRKRAQPRRVEKRERAPRRGARCR